MTVKLFSIAVYHFYGMPDNLHVKNKNIYKIPLFCGQNFYKLANIYV